MRRSIRTYCKDETGAVAGIYAVALIGLIAIGGVGFDYARMAGMDSELQNGADQAALAAVTQLDENDGACARADAAGIGLLSNITLLSNVDPDDGSIARNEVTVNSGTGALTGNDQCGNRGYIKFYSSYTNPATNTIATTDETAAFVEVAVDSRTARYAFTPIVGAIFATMSARAVAGTGSAICNVPPLMICDPTEGNFDANALRGVGVQLTAGGGNSWAPGAFGFLQVGQGNSHDTVIKALAFDQFPLDCVAVDKPVAPSTGNDQNYFKALNTRFDIHPNGMNGGNVFAPCAGGACPSPPVAVKDLIRPRNAAVGNKCELKNNEWELPPAANRFNPTKTYTAGDTKFTNYMTAAQLANTYAMGMPRDTCHYTAYGRTCAQANGLPASSAGRYGNGVWPMGDYLRKYHPGIVVANLPNTKPTNPTDFASSLWQGMTRYQLYSAEAQYNVFAGGNTSKNYGSNTAEFMRGGQCMSGTTDVRRRVLSVAVVTNCPSLGGTSTPAQFKDWVDVFLVQPIADDSTEVNRGRPHDSLYVEIIGPNDFGSGSVIGATVRKDKPYLIE